MVSLFSLYGLFMHILWDSFEKNACNAHKKVETLLNIVTMWVEVSL